MIRSLCQGEFPGSTAIEVRPAQESPRGELVGRDEKAFPGNKHLLRDYLDYWRAKRRLAGVTEDIECLFRHFLAASIGRSCLRLGFDASREPYLGPNWASADLGRIAPEAGHARLDVGAGQVDAIYISGLERVARPAWVITEVLRVLKHAGQIWVQVPFNAPYAPPDRNGLREYWRISPDGLRVLMNGFDEIFCACLPSGSALRTTSFFYGLKPPPAAEPARRP